MVFVDVHAASLLGHVLILLEAVLVTSVTGLGSFSLMLDFVSVLFFPSSLFHGWERCKLCKQMGFCHTS